MSKNTANWLIFFLFFFIGFAIYSNSFDAPFIFDDADNIKNPNLQIESLGFSEFKEVVAGGTLKSRPVSNWSFALNYYFGGYKVQGYHLVNILIHILAAYFLYHVIRLTLSFPPNSAYLHKDSVALFTALLWLAHPLATQSVTYIVQRMNSMAAMFYIFSFLLYILARKEMGHAVKEGRAIFKVWVYFAGCLTSSLLAFGSKEIAATLPLSIFLYEWFFFQDLSFSWLKNKFIWVVGLGLVLLAVAYFYTDGHLIERTLGSGGGRDFSTWERVLTEFRVVAHYLGLLIIPHPDRLAFDYNIQHSTSFLTPISTLVSFIFLSVLFIGATLVSLKERFLSFCIIWFFINLAIESSIIGLELVFEHRTYLPSMFALAIIPALFYRLVGSKMIGNLIFIFIFLIFSTWTLERNTVWRDPERFWLDSLEKYPKKFRGHHNLGVFSFRNGEYDLAEYHVRKSLSLNPQKIYQIYNTLGAILKEQGDIEGAITAYKESLKSWRRYPSAIKNLGALYYKEKRYEDVIAHYREALKYSKVKRLSNESLLFFGLALSKIGEYVEATRMLKMLYDRDPGHLETIIALADNLTASGKVTEAKKYYIEAVKINSEAADANYNLAMIYMQESNIEKSLFHFEKAVNNRPEYFPVNYNYGNILLRLGKLDLAESQYQVLLGDSALLPDVLNNIGLIHVERGDLFQAKEYFKKSLCLKGESNQAKTNLELVDKIVLEKGSRTGE